MLPWNRLTKAPTPSGGVHSTTDAAHYAPAGHPRGCEAPRGITLPALVGKLLRGLAGLGVVLAGCVAHRIRPWRGIARCAEWRAALAR